MLTSRYFLMRSFDNFKEVFRYIYLASSQKMVKDKTLIILLIIAYFD